MHNIGRHTVGGHETSKDILYILHDQEMITLYHFAKSG